MRIISPHNDSVFDAMLRLPREGMPWRLEQWQVRERWIDSRYRARNGGWAIVRVLAAEHPAPPAEFRSRVTETLRLVVLRSSTDADVPRLLDALIPQVLAHEHALAWIRKPQPTPETTMPMEPHDLQVESLAFEAGIKPALRMRMDRWELPYDAGIWQRAGMATTVIEFAAGPHQFSYLMVARTLAHAEALADAELRQFLARPACFDAMRDCGELLGYPRCCIEAFVQSTLTEDGEDSEIDARRSNFDRLDRAWVPAPHPHLNTLRVRQNLALVSFDPCSLACPAALEIAHRTAAAAEAACPGYGETLRGTYALDHDDNRIALELDADRRVISARATHDEAEPFAQRIVGHRVDEHGRVGTLSEPCRVVEFR